MNKILSNVVIHKDYSKDIVRILKSNRSDEVIRKKLSKYHENDIADAVKLLDKEKRIRLYNILVFISGRYTRVYRRTVCG